MSVNPETIKVQCRSCKGMFRLVGGICIEQLCRACHGAAPGFDQCLAERMGKVSVDEVLAGAPPETLDVLERVFTKPGVVKSKIEAARRNAAKRKLKAKKARPSDQANTPHAMARRRVEAVMGRIWDDLGEDLANVSVPFGDSCLVLTVAFSLDDIETCVLPQSMLRDYPALAQRFPRLTRKPPLGSMWGLVALADGVQAVTKLCLGSAQPWMIVEQSHSPLGSEAGAEILSILEQGRARLEEEAETTNDHLLPTLQTHLRLQELLGNQARELAQKLSAREGGEQHVGLILETPSGAVRTLIASLARLREEEETLEDWPLLRQDPIPGTAWVAVRLRDGTSSTAAVPLSGAPGGTFPGTACVA